VQGIISDAFTWCNPFSLNSLVFALGDANFFAVLLFAPPFIRDVFLAFLPDDFFAVLR